MFARFRMSPIAMISRLTDRLASWLLGSVARASRLVADADAALVGLIARPIPIEMRRSLTTIG